MPVAWLWLLTWLAAGGQGEELPAELAPFVLPQHQALDVAVGDLNGDGRSDAVLVLKPEDEEERDGDMELRRPLLLLIRSADGKLEQARRNDKVVYCRSCGGMMGDPYEGIQLEEGAFTVSHYGGSAWRWGSAYTFRYDAAEQDWFLERDYGVSFHAMDPDEKTEETLTREELGDVRLADFDPFYWEAPPKPWRVVAARAHFYDHPEAGSVPRKAYLVAGDAVEALRELRHFVQASFTNQEGQTTSGYLLKKDLEPVDARPTR